MDLYNQLKYLNTLQANYNNDDKDNKRPLTFNSNNNQHQSKAKMNDYIDLSSSTISSQLQAQQQARASSKQQANVKMIFNNQNLSNETEASHQETIVISNETFAQIKRKFFKFLYIYAIIIISLYTAYFCCNYFYQTNNNNNNLPVKKEQQSSSEHLISGRSSSYFFGQPDLISSEQQEKLESKISLLERYIELIAVDLQETKNRLREREKCDCSISCTFNNTQYSDGSTWQSQCDTCTCRVSCVS